MSLYSRQFSLMVSGLGCDRGGTPVFRSASFKLTPGGVTQLFGENGAGKSSLLSVLAGHVKPAEGLFKWTCNGGEEFVDIPKSASLFLGHEQSAKPSLTVTENLRFWAALYAANASVPEFLARVGLQNYRDATTARLSAGQRRRLDMARLLIAGRSIWLLDEPAASLDKNGEDLLAELINDHTAKGGVAVIATHHRLPVTSSELVLG